VELDAALPFLSLSCSELILLPASNRHRLELVRMTRDLGVLNTLLALIEIGTRRTMEAIAGEDFAGACRTLLNKLGRVAVVKMPQNHHR